MRVLAFSKIITNVRSVSLDPVATGPARLEVGLHQFGLLAGVVASVEYLASLDESARGSRPERLAISMRSVTEYLIRLFDYLLHSLRSLPLVMMIGQPEARIPVVSFAVRNVPAERVVQRLADNGVLAIANAGELRHHRPSEGGAVFTLDLPVATTVPLLPASDEPKTQLSSADG